MQLAEATELQQKEPERQKRQEGQNRQEGQDKQERQEEEERQEEHEEPQRQEGQEEQERKGRGTGGGPKRKTWDQLGSQSKRMLTAHVMEELDELAESRDTESHIIAANVIHRLVCIQT